MLGPEGHEAAGDDANRIQPVPGTLEGHDHLRTRAKAHRHDEETALAQLIAPGNRDIAHARRRDDAVVRRERRMSRVPVARDDAHSGVAGTREMLARLLSDIGLDVDADDRPPGADEAIEERSVVARADADLEDPLSLLDREGLEHRTHDEDLAR